MPVTNDVYEPDVELVTLDDIQQVVTYINDTQDETKFLAHEALMMLMRSYCGNMFLYVLYGFSLSVWYGCNKRADVHCMPVYVHWLICTET